MLMICRCLEKKGSHNVREELTFLWYPLEDGCHTNFTVFQCLDCLGYCGMPPRNFELALKSGLTLSEIDLFLAIILYWVIINDNTL